LINQFSRFFSNISALWYFRFDVDCLWFKYHILLINQFSRFFSDISALWYFRFDVDCLWFKYQMLDIVRLIYPDLFHQYLHHSVPFSNHLFIYCFYYILSFCVLCLLFHSCMWGYFAYFGPFL
jgi:hypothetical protein